MEQLLKTAAYHAGLLFEAMALVVILVGCVEAFFGGLRVQFAAVRDPHEMRHVWLRFSRWLVGGLTFLLAADVVHTTVTPTWEDIGQLGAIALIRTWINYFLERDIADLRELQREDRKHDADGRQEP
jgi:uncharacterized membrane protein